MNEAITPEGSTELNDLSIKMRHRTENIDNGLETTSLNSESDSDQESNVRQSDEWMEPPSSVHSGHQEFMFKSRHIQMMALGSFPTFSN